MCDIDNAVTSTMQDFAETVAPKLKAAIEKHMHPRLSQVSARERANELRSKALDEREKALLAKERALNQREEEVAARERAVEAGDVSLSVISNVPSPLAGPISTTTTMLAEATKDVAAPGNCGGAAAGDMDAVAFLRNLPSPARAGGAQPRRASDGAHNHAAEQPSSVSSSASFMLSEKTPDRIHGHMSSPRGPAGGASSIREMFEQRVVQKAAEAATPQGTQPRSVREQRQTVPAPAISPAARGIPPVALREARSSVPPPASAYTPKVATPAAKQTLAELLAADEKARQLNVV